MVVVLKINNFSGHDNIDLFLQVEYCLIDVESNLRKHKVDTPGTWNIQENEEIEEYKVLSKTTKTKGFLSLYPSFSSYTPSLSKWKSTKT